MHVFTRSQLGTYGNICTYVGSAQIKPLKSQFAMKVKIIRTYLVKVEEEEEEETAMEVLEMLHSSAMFRSLIVVV